MNVRLQDILPLAAALGAARASGLLTALVERPGSAADLATRCGVDERACARVLDVLTVFGVATHDGDCYGASQELAHEKMRPEALMRMESTLWRHVPEFLATGTPLLAMDAAPAEREGHYRNVVAELAKLFATAAEHLADRCGLAPQSILEVGCGSGVWSLALARRLPATHVTGVDLPGVLDRFRERATVLGMSDRIHTIEGDMHSVALPQGRWDLAIIANVLRLEQPAAARSLLERVVAAIRPGGALLVIDALAAGSPDAERARAIYSLHLAMRTRAGRVHTPRDIARWMEEAGCETPTPLAFDEEFTDAGALGALVASRRPQQPRPAGARQ